MYVVNNNRSCESDYTNVHLHIYNNKVKSVLIDLMFYQI